MMMLSESGLPPGPSNRPGPSPVSLQALRGAPVLQGLSEAGLQAVARACTWHRYEAGEIVACADIAGFCVVASGRVLLTTYEKSGRQVAFKIMSEGDGFGAVSLLLGLDGAAPVEAITLAPSLIAKIDAPSFLALLRGDADFALSMLRFMARTVWRFSQRIVELSTMTVRGRVMASLLHMAHRAGVQANQARLTPAPRHQVLANFVGATREQVSRELSGLQRAGLLGKDGRALVIPDVARLQKLLGQMKARG